MENSKDEDGFPLAGVDNAFTVYRDEYLVSWVCEYEDDPEITDYVWRRLGGL